MKHLNQVKHHQGTIKQRNSPQDIQCVVAFDHINKININILIFSCIIT